MRFSRTKILSLLLVTIFLVAILVGLKRFEVWEQITALENADTSDLLFTPGGIHPHALRFLLMMPVVLAAQWMRIDQDFLFSLVCWAAIGTTATLAGKTLSLLRKGQVEPWHRNFIPPYLFLSLVSLAMHGRIILSFTGLTLLVHAQVQWQTGVIKSYRTLLFRTLLGFMLTSVSSGTLMVSAMITGAFILWMPLAPWPRIQRRNLPLMGVGLVLMAGASPLLIIGIRKNIQFFGGGGSGLLHMLNHGPGKLLIALGRESLMLVFAIGLSGLVAGLAVAFAINLFFRKQAPSTPVWIALVCAMMIGVFGFSTLLVGLPPLFILVWKRLTRPPGPPLEPRRG